MLFKEMLNINYFGSQPLTFEHRATLLRCFKLQYLLLRHWVMAYGSVASFLSMCGRMLRYMDIASADVKRKQSVKESISKE